METVDCGEINNYPCAYAQQGYVFGRVGLYVYLFIYLYVCQQKKQAPLENIPPSIFYYFLTE